MVISGTTRLAVLALLALTFFGGAQGAALAQEDNQAATRLSGWRGQCASASRSAALTCSIEQSVLMAGTGQQLALVSVRVPDDAARTEMVIQLPYGLYLPDGVKLQFDDKKAETHQVRTCDGKGCYIVLKEAARIAVAMKAGKNFKITFKNLALNDIEVVMPLDGFTDAYKIAK